jgi:hypothetical protein
VRVRRAVPALSAPIELSYNLSALNETATPVASGFDRVVWLFARYELHIHETQATEPRLDPIAPTSCRRRIFNSGRLAPRFEKYGLSNVVDGDPKPMGRLHFEGSSMSTGDDGRVRRCQADRFRRSTRPKAG